MELYGDSSRRTREAVVSRQAYVKVDLKAARIGDYSSMDIVFLIDRCMYLGR